MTSRSWIGGVDGFMSQQQRSIARIQCEGKEESIAEVDGTCPVKGARRCNKAIESVCVPEYSITKGFNLIW